METDHTEVERRLLDVALRPGAVALDAGCGRTTRLRNYRDRIVRLVGVDADEDAGRANPYLDEFVLADLDDALPFADDSFNLVYANFVVEHLEHPERTFAEWRRVLRPGGHLVLLTSNRANPLMAAADRLPRRGAACDQAPRCRSRRSRRLPDAIPREHATRVRGRDRGCGVRADLGQLRRNSPPL